MALLAAITLVCLASSVWAQSCIGNGVYNSQFDKCYHFFFTLQPFLDASKVCDGIGGQLVSIHSAFEKAFLLENAREAFEMDDFWIGLTDFDVEGTFSWFDGSPLTYTNWENGYPVSTPSTDCVASRLNNGLWYNTDCDNTKFFVCTVDPYLKSVTVGDKYCSGKGTFYNDSQVCFYFITLVQNYFDAAKTCKSVDGILVTLENQAKQKFVAGSARQKFDNSYWIGLNDLEDDGQWQWDNLPNVSYVNWKKGYPVNDSNKSCVLAEVITGTWENVNCDTEQHGFVCETQPARSALSTGGWSYFAATNAWYLPLYNKTMWTWNEREDYCITLGGHLASIHSVEENDFVFGLGMGAYDCNDCDVQIGLKSAAGDIASFAWTDGSPVDYTRWRSGYPSGAYFCGFQYQWQWHNHDCSTRRYDILVGVCKKPNV